MELSSAEANALVADAIEAAGFDTTTPELLGALGRYEVRGELGAGAMGSVYDGYDHELGRRVAIKRVKQRHSTRAGRARFLKEARALAALSHPNVVTAYEAGWHGHELFLVMEFVPGVTLRRWLAAHRSIAEIGDVVLQAARGLEAVHRKGLVHRDFKPENVIIGDDNRVRVVDFGLVWAALGSGEASTHEVGSDPDSRVTAEGRAVGTPAYMAPEQASGDDIGPAADQYALCAVLCEALCGARPKPGVSPARSLRAARVPRALATVVTRGLAKDAEDRFPSLADLIAALERTRRRRSWFWPALAFVALAGVAIAATAPQRCDTEAKLAGVWDEDAAQGIAAAFARVGTADAGTIAALDTYASQWRDGYKSACEGAAGSGAAFDAQMACLESARGRFASLVGLLRGGDVEIAGRSLHAAWNLPDVTRCFVDVPAATSAALHEVRALVDLGKAAAALERLDAVRRASDDPTVNAEADLLRGRALQRRDRIVPALQAYADAHWGGNAVRRDDIAAEAAARRVVLLRTYEARPAEAETWLRHAEAAMRPEHGPRFVALLYQARASAAGGRDRFAEEEQHLEAAVAALVAAYGSDDPRTAEPIVASAEVARVRDDFANADARYRRALAVYERAYGPLHPAVGDVRLGLGRVAISREAFAEATIELEAAEQVFTAAFGPQHPRLGEVREEQASAAFGLGEYERATELARQTLELVRSSEDPSRVREAGALRIMGVVATERGELDDAESALLRAESLYAEAYGPENSRVASMQRALAMVYRRRGDPLKGIELLERALAIDERVHGEHSLPVAFSLANLGSLYDAAGQPEEGIANLSMAREILVGILGPEHTLAAQLDSNLGNILLFRGQPAKAQEHLARALEVGTRTFGPDHLQLAFIRDGLGRAALGRGEPDSAVEHLADAVRLRRTPGESPDRLAYSLSGLAEALNAAGREQEARTAANEAQALVPE